MEIARLVLDYLRVLLWPLVVLLGVWIVRRQIPEIASRVTRLETPVGTVELEARKVNEAAEAVAQQSLVVPEPLPEPAPITAEQLLTEARDLVGPSPDAAVLIAWRAVDQRFQQLMREIHGSDVRYVNPRKALDDLVPLGMSADAAALLPQLASVRAKVAHEATSLTPATALGYIESCEIILQQLNGLDLPGDRTA
ncbi:hypothetical protein [Kitasatospora phosalacinea]|uniref:DUF4145 domain-containing protein n=1 Tax=Kitasatospora phosalacinea TaxID=2065 RepID=A0A9W6PFI9_9ACTN|nr:hypothetical protein [Kitasatospora phosalacinea]GLW53957.1 hypothetical protein Kpho01_19680 [Kitasatospora phosalacinea]